MTANTAVEGRKKPHLISRLCRDNIFSKPVELLRFLNKTSSERGKGAILPIWGKTGVLELGSDKIAAGGR